MYGGLFGDLPQAKSAKDSNCIISEERSADGDPSGCTPGNAQKSSNASVSRSEKQSSIVKSVGNSGTAAAFVPLAALKPRKRPAAPPSHKPAMFKKSASLISTPFGEETVVSIERKAKQATTSQDIKAYQDSMKASVLVTEESRSDNVHSIVNNTNKVDPDHDASTSDRKRRLRQIALDDPYDPMVPNDLLQYWESKAVAVEREKLERQQLENIREQQLLRQRLERERRELEREGDVDRLVQYEQQHGRGRGVTNLPAWLLAKQKHASELGQKDA